MRPHAKVIRFAASPFRSPSISFRYSAKRHPVNASTPDTGLYPQVLLAQNCPTAAGSVWTSGKG